MNFDTVIQRVWPSVRQRYLFPELPMPEVVETGDGDVCI